MYNYIPYTQNQFVQPYMPQPPRQPVVLNGRWGFVKSYKDIEEAQVPADGSQTIFMLENEPTFYLVGFQNGRKMINGFSFHALNADNGSSAPKAEPQAVSGNVPDTASFEARLAAVEKFMHDLNGDEGK